MPEVGKNLTSKFHQAWLTSVGACDPPWTALVGRPLDSRALSKLGICFTKSSSGRSDWGSIWHNRNKSWEDNWMTKKICFWYEPVYSQSQFYQELAKQKWESQLCKDVNLIYLTPWFIFLLPKTGPRTRQGKSPAWWRQSFHIRTAWVLFSFVVYSLHLHGQQMPLPQGCQLVGYAPEGFSPWWLPFESHKLAGICAQQMNSNFSYTLSVESLPQLHFSSR